LTGPGDWRRTQFEEELQTQIFEPWCDHYGPELREAPEVLVELLVQKVVMVRPLRGQSTMTLKWIPQRL